MSDIYVLYTHAYLRTAVTRLLGDHFFQKEDVIKKWAFNVFRQQKAEFLDNFEESQILFV